jgi:hypothetical protein
MERVFAEPQDIHEPWGALRFGAESLKYIGDVSGLVPMRNRCVVPRADGSYDLYGFSPWKGSPKRILRARTWDGLHFEGSEILFEDKDSAAWMGESEIAWSPDTGKFLALAWARGPYHSAWAIGSDDGAKWRLLKDGPVYQDHDAFGLTWNRDRKCWVCYQNTYEPDKKIMPDNIGDRNRRVLRIITSEDGVNWEGASRVHPKENLFAPPEQLMTPDEQDPPELEFYRFTPFEYAGRWVGMMLNYAASPQNVNPHFPRTKHGPQLSGEWWISNDGLSWRRPFREVFAPGEADDIIMHPPMNLCGQHRWVIRNRGYGLTENQIFYAGSLSNSRFSTPVFEIPQAPLQVRAELCFHGNRTRGFRGQGYLMVELVEPDGNPITGYEKERCAITREPDAPLPLVWGGDTFSSPLAGRKARARFHLRDARVYALIAEV